MPSSSAPIITHHLIIRHTKTISPKLAAPIPNSKTQLKPAHVEQTANYARLAKVSHCTHATICSEHETRSGDLWPKEDATYMKCEVNFVTRGHRCKHSRAIASLRCYQYQKEKRNEIGNKSAPGP